MSSTNDDRELEAFETLIGTPIADRQAELKRLEELDLKLHDRVRRLLDAYESAESLGFLDDPPEDIRLGEWRSGDQVGAYKIISKLGDGGFGVVYRAVQSDPIEREVAIKLIRAGMNTDQVIQRFESERELLSMMDHPGIARVLDAGTHADRPYVVMELVGGIDITEYCDRHKLSIDDRLELFEQVCRAVEHAHQRGVIHRDLKPSNVLVMNVDHAPLVKVIDFGVAKAIDSSMRNHDITQELQLIGTPEYMSPEQANGDRGTVDTRSDIYAMGVLLYELLTGVTPFSRKQLQGIAYREVLRVLAEDQPPKPSTRLSTVESLDEIAKARQIVPARLQSVIRGDLDMIIMKAIAKEKDRRYSTATEIASDVRRFLANEPVLARPPSKIYISRKFVHRHRTAVVFSCVLLLAVVVGVWASLMFAIRAVNAEELATQRALDTQSELDRANEIKSVLRRMITSSTPESAQGLDTALLRRVLDETRALLADREITDPRARAEIQSIIGLAYLRIGEPVDAQTLLSAALVSQQQILESLDPERVDTEFKLGQALSALGKHGDALVQFESVIESYRTTHGEQSKQLLVVERHILREREQIEGAEALVNDYEQSVARHRSILTSDHIETIESMLDHASCLSQLNRYDEAEPILGKVVAGCRKLLGDNAPRTIRAMYSHMIALARSGQYKIAKPLSTEVIARGKAVFGDEHPFMREAMRGYSYILQAQGRHDYAIKVVQKSIDEQTRLLGRLHPSVTVLRGSLGDLYIGQGDSDLANGVIETMLVDAEEHDGERAELSALIFELSRLIKGLAQSEPEQAAIFRIQLERQNQRFNDENGD
jgi:serine/threonine protein kinase